MSSLKLVLGVLSFIPAIIAYYIYFTGMFAGRIKPHTFSWLIWGILAANGFLAQRGAHAGMGAWATGLTSVASLTIFCCALWLGSLRPSLFDWILLSLALVGLGLLLIVHNEHISLLLTLIALVAGFVMNIRKAYNKPHEENGAAFVLNTLKFIPAIGALATFSFLTVAYPLVATIGNASVALVVYVRRRAV